MSGSTWSKLDSGRFAESGQSKSCDTDRCLKFRLWGLKVNFLFPLMTQPAGTMTGSSPEQIDDLMG